MLKSLLVQNYALIQHLEISFDSGLSIISGETGAGKSILMGALSLILGQRADTSVLYDREKKCVVEGSFFIKPYGLNTFFRENELDYDDTVIIRREINHQGKSRAFVNDTPVGLQVLKELGQQLVDIHSQHQNLMLGDNRFQLEVLDAFGRHYDLLQRYETEYEEYLVARHEYESLKNRSEKATADLDYIGFQYDQLEKAGLVEGEQNELEEELETLSHAEEIRENLLKSYYLLAGEEGDVLGRMREVQSLLTRISAFYSPASELEKRVESAYLEMKDLSEELERLGNTVEYDPRRIVVVQERIDLIYSLQQKHKVSTVGELIRIKNDLKKQIDEIDSFDFRLEEAKKYFEACHEKLEKTAGELTARRRGIIPELEKEITGLLKELAIPHARFAVELEEEEDFQPSGKDRVTFLFSANKQGALMDISRVASGGELSRVMLSLKSLITRSSSLPTVIFDEVDAGVSGEIADKVGNILRRMAEHLQVINITHLPQIAGKGKHHYLVYKTDTADRTVTHIKLLNEEERIQEIAKMLSGEEVTPAAYENARILLRN
ncbi:MAG TPA: DNA repair protein RecN [Bacteroidetes bacterium]|nr:DNA repair protein RecN [Bacteroidota bacterium]